MQLKKNLYNKILSMEDEFKKYLTEKAAFELS